MPIGCSSCVTPSHRKHVGCVVSRSRSSPQRESSIYSIPSIEYVVCMHGTLECAKTIPFIMGWFLLENDGIKNTPIRPDRPRRAFCVCIIFCRCLYLHYSERITFRRDDASVSFSHQTAFLIPIRLCEKCEIICRCFPNCSCERGTGTCRNSFPCNESHHDNQIYWWLGAQLMLWFVAFWGT